LQYPDGFNTPVFPAGKTIAVSRAMAIAVMVTFFLIICMCGLLLWAKKSVQIHPFLISVNDITGQWEVIGHQHGAQQQMTSTRALQESVIGKFIRNWFLITDNDNFNTDIWSSCDRETECNPNDKRYAGADKCNIYCITSQEVYDTFSKHLQPLYQSYFDEGVTWQPNMRTLRMIPIGEIKDIGGTWQVRATIITNASQQIDILAYAKVERNQDLYPQTLGYYIADFNAYKVN
jgi:hypothetical protein